MRQAMTGVDELCTESRSMSVTVPGAQRPDETLTAFSVETLADALNRGVSPDRLLRSRY
jgi:hypothetical protein